MLLEAVNRGLSGHPAIWTRPIYSHSYSESVTPMTVSSSRLKKSKISLSRWSLQATKRQLPHSRLRGTCWRRTRTIRERFDAELETVLGDHPPTYDDLQDLEFTENIITEALRLYPPIHTIPRRTKSDVEVNGFRIPEDHEIHLSVIHVHRDRQFYDDPLSFRPERWTDEFEEELHDFAYVPFGGGRRTCIGREFALLEAKIVLATIGQQFEFVWEKNRDIELEPRVTTRSKEGIPLKLSPR